MKRTIKSFFSNLFRKEEFTLEKDEQQVFHKLKRLQRKIGYYFTDPQILVTALTHTSCYYNSDLKVIPISEYERMEFLGDSVLGMVTAEFLYNKYTNKKEGYLSKLKSQIVSENFLSVKAKSIDLGDYIILGEEEYRDKGYQKKSILSNMMESLICAIYLDGDYEKAKKFINEFILKGYRDELTNEIHINYKSKLQEFCQSKYKQLPAYKVVAAEGPDHRKVFNVTVYIQGKKIGSGSGFTKKNAEQDAAKDGCRTLNI